MRKNIKLKKSKFTQVLAPIFYDECVINYKYIYIKILNNIFKSELLKFYFLSYEFLIKKKKEVISILLNF